MNSMNANPHIFECGMQVMQPCKWLHGSASSCIVDDNKFLFLPPTGAELGRHLAGATWGTSHGDQPWDSPVYTAPEVSHILWWLARYGGTEPCDGCSSLRHGNALGPTSSTCHSLHSHTITGLMTPSQA